MTGLTVDIDVVNVSAKINQLGNGITDIVPVRFDKLPDCQPSTGTTAHILFKNHNLLENSISNPCDKESVSHCTNKI